MMFPLILVCFCNEYRETTFEYYRVNRSPQDFISLLF